MKLSSTVRGMLLDCGKASKKTRGSVAAAYAEGGTAPANKYNP